MKATLTMLTIVKNNVWRALANHSYMLTTAIMTLLPIILAIYFTSHFEVKGNIALVDGGALPTWYKEVSERGREQSGDGRLGHGQKAQRTSDETLEKSRIPQVGPSKEKLLQQLRSARFNVDVMQEAPPLSTLVRNKYDAVILLGNRDVSNRGVSNRDVSDRDVSDRDVSDRDVSNRGASDRDVSARGEIEVFTVKSVAFKTKLLQALTLPATKATLPASQDTKSRVKSKSDPLTTAGNASPEEATRGIGANIVGYLVMFILLGGLLFMDFFTADKQKGTFKRIATSPAGIGRYLAAQYAFTFAFVFVPSLALLVATKEVFRLDIGFTYGEYAFLLALLALLSSAFALVVTAAMEKADNIFSFGSSVIILTSLLSGSFFALAKDSAIAYVSHVLPQKHVMTLAQGFERQAPLADYVGEISYVLLFVAVSFAVGVVICARKFRTGNY